MKQNGSEDCQTEIKMPPNVNQHATKIDPKRRWDHKLDLLFEKFDLWIVFDAFWASSGVQFGSQNPPNIEDKYVQIRLKTLSWKSCEYYEKCT